MRQRCARWFEIVVPRPCLARAVERIATTGAVELDTESEVAAGLDLSDAGPELETYHRLYRAYHDYWPQPHVSAASEDVPIESALRGAIGQLREWENDAESLVDRLDSIKRDRAALDDLRGFLVAMQGDETLDFGTLAAARASVVPRLFVMLPESSTPKSARPVLKMRVDAEERAYLLVVGTPEHLDQLEDELVAAGARAVTLPEWLEGNAEQALDALARHEAELDRAAEQTREAIDASCREHDVAGALGQIRRLEWMLEHLPAVQVSDYLARITGWTDCSTGDELTEPLSRDDIPAVLEFQDPPENREPPRLTHNPVWARPFELFMQLMGTPGPYETDPSRMLAFIAPTLFGYMFGDIGQGAVLMIAGFLLRRRLPVLALMIPGGAMAMVFGVLFGTVFAIEGLFEPLWLNPVHHPLTVLIVPVFGGAALILLGLLLNGLGALRRRAFLAWLRTDAGLVLAYVGALATPFASSAGGLAIGAGIAWYLTGCLWQWREGAAAVLGQMGELLERLLQLAVNTLSFLRVGAFALAHAGLSVAVMTLAESAPGIVVEGTVLVLGNLLILLLEGLVVSVQTTRLILFEFFIRFFRAEGRPFRPMTPPSAG